LTKKLIIAEKPSVANDIARVLGGFTRVGDYYENDSYVLSSAIGHLLEIAAPEEYEVKRGKWSFANLPVVPPHFDLRPIERTEDRLKLLSKLVKRKDVTGVMPVEKGNSSSAISCSTPVPKSRCKGSGFNR
jgi:DNA topoisomerase-3